VAFENFELRQSYRPGQVFVFGVVAREPWEIRPAVKFLSPPKSPEVH
jgi:hypothetical protein